MIIDLTHTITPEIPLYAGAPGPRLFKAAKLSVNGYRETQMNLLSHTGTHMDAPAHMLQSGSTLDELPVSQFCGRAVVLDVSDRDTITADYLKEQNGLLRSVDFVLFYTGWEKRWPDAAFRQDGYACPDGEAAKYLVSCGLKGVGTDAVSIDPVSSSDFPAHKTLMEGGLVIMECMCLKKVAGRSDLQLFALPMKYENADGAPIRAVAQIRDFSEKEME